MEERSQIKKVEANLTPKISKFWSEMVMDVCMEECLYESESDSQFSDDSQNDPSFDVVEETRLTLSDLSLKRKPKRPDIR